MYGASLQFNNSKYGFDKQYPKTLLFQLNHCLSLPAQEKWHLRRKLGLDALALAEARRAASLLHHPITSSTLKEVE